MEQIGANFIASFQKMPLHFINKQYHLLSSYQLTVNRWLNYCHLSMINRTRFLWCMLHNANDTRTQKCAYICVCIFARTYSPMNLTMNQHFGCLTCAYNKFGMRCRWQHFVFIIIIVLARTCLSVIVITTMILVCYHHNLCSAFVQALNPPLSINEKYQASMPIFRFQLVSSCSHIVHYGSIWLFSW